MKTFSRYKLLLLLIFNVGVCTVARSQEETVLASAMKEAGTRESISLTRSGNGLGSLKWKFKTQGKIFSSPAIFYGVAFVGSGDHHLYAIEVATGRLKWKFKTGGPVHSSPKVHQTTVYVGSFDGYYYAIDASTGREQWKVKTNGERWMGGKGYLGMKPQEQDMDDPWDYFLSSPLLHAVGSNLTMYFGSSDGNLYAVDAANGRIKWKFAAAGGIHTTPCIYDNTLYFGSWDTNLYAIDSETGKLKWKFKTGEQPGMSGIQASPTIDDGKVYFGARDAHMYALDALTGRVIWKYDAEKSWILSSAAVSDGVVYVGTSDSFLMLALEAKTGREKFRFYADGYVYSSPVVYDNAVFFGDFTGKIFSVDLASEGKEWSEFVTDGRTENGAAILNEKGKMDFALAGSGKDLSIYNNVVDTMNKFYRLGPIVSTPAIEDGVLYVGSADGFLYSIYIGESSKR